MWPWLGHRQLVKTLREKKKRVWLKRGKLKVYVLKVSCNTHSKGLQASPAVQRERGGERVDSQGRSGCCSSLSSRGKEPGGTQGETPGRTPGGSPGGTPAGPPALTPPAPAAAAGGTPAPAPPPSPGSGMGPGMGQRLLPGHRAHGSPKQRH